ncbi:hypothetical protein YYC_05862 [Plasmodium yoelii 17X]|uniref:YIR protein n=1 Tax=Plasmodium yoelii 17X TaxID=1323249 RepID=V7P9B9_PLAYE|nr:hypothetical protein YYC_05862 [Plasmodium yoelii 17X]
MLTSTVCEEFDSLRGDFPDEWDDSENYIFTSRTLKQHCPDQECKNYINLVKGGYLWLLDRFYGSKTVFYHYSNNNIDIVVYIIMWLGYKLNKMLKTQFHNINEFCDKHMKSIQDYKKNIDGVEGYSSYNDLINKKTYLLTMSIKDISKFYDAFKSLCNMYSELNENNNQCKTCFENAGELFEKYEKLKNALDINKESSYYQLLSILSNDYKKFKEKYNTLECSSTLPFVVCPRSSVTKNILIIIGIIFVAASILLGVSYKYSLFGFRKRSQKQHLREMLKK